MIELTFVSPTTLALRLLWPSNLKIAWTNEKRWSCLFTCLIVTAYMEPMLNTNSCIKKRQHIEIVPKLNTDSCLNAIKRYIARRGKPSTIISDNVTNIVGTEKKCRVCCNMQQRRYRGTSISKGIRKKFHRQAATHYGGVWERLAGNVIKNCMQFWGTDQSLRAILQLPCVLWSKHHQKTVDSSHFGR